MTAILPGGLGELATVSGSSWDPTTAYSGIFSNNNRTVTGSGSGFIAASCKGTRSHNSGKYYFEMLANPTQHEAGSYQSVGLGNSSYSPSSTLVGVDTHSVGAINNGGNTYYTWYANGTIIFSATAHIPFNGDVFGFAVDNTGAFGSATAVWFALNGSWLTNSGSFVGSFPSSTPNYNPTGLGIQTMWPATTCDSTCIHTINTGQQPFLGLPAGFVAWG